MQRRWQPTRRRKVTAPSVGREEVQCAVPGKEPIDFRSATKLEVVRATAHCDVLAMVDRFAASAVEIRAGSPAELATRLKQPHFTVANHQSGSSCHAGQSTADN